MTAYEIDSLVASLNKMKLLFWRLDLSRRTFSSRNQCPEVLLCAEDCRFFKDRGYRERLVHPEDRIPLEQALACFSERRPVQLVFRIQQDEHKIHWYKLSGWPTEDFRYYDGAVEELSEQTINDLQKIFEQQNRVLLEHADVPYPIALFLWPDCRLQKANLPYAELLGLTPRTNRKVRLNDLLNSDINLPALLEALISDRQLTTELTLLADGGATLKATCRLEYFWHEGQSYLRMAVLEQGPKKRTGKQQGDKKQISQLCEQLADCWSIDAMLEKIYQSRELFPGLDAVMYSDIYARKNRVVVYARGELKEPLEQGSQFPYTGTIAENIEKENLEYLIVEDTQRSIKAIDWMLFVPKGIYSYIAKALYVRGAMRTVLIFCSQQKNSFSEHQVEAVNQIAKAFHKQLKKIRRIGA